MRRLLEWSKAGGFELFDMGVVEIALPGASLIAFLAIPGMLDGTLPGVPVARQRELLEQCAAQHDVSRLSHVSYWTLLAWRAVD